MRKPYNWKHWPWEGYVEWKVAIESPVEKERKTLPRGDGNWPGYDRVWSRLQDAAHNLAANRAAWLSDDHIHTMAVLGSGHEETMKAWMHICIQYGWC